jgi:hypothetical protein
MIKTGRDEATIFSDHRPIDRPRTRIIAGISFVLPDGVANSYLVELVGL